MYRKKYIIDKGQHYVRWYQMVPCFHYNLQEVKFSFKPDNSWYWYPARDNNDKDINKLFGIGFGLSHHNNSIRIGWRPDFDKKNHIEYLAYWYDSTGHQSKSFGVFSINQKMSGGFSGLQSSEYMIFLNEHIIQIPNISTDKKWGMYLRPYVGGNNTAIQQMQFKIEWVKS